MSLVATTLVSIIASSMSFSNVARVGVLPARAPRATARINMAISAKNGPFAPAVFSAKALLGEEKLNKLRGQVIAQHTKVISAFVGSSSSKNGERAMRVLFRAADRNDDGLLELGEVRSALQAMGFRHLTDDKVQAIFERADENEDGLIDYEEFKRETPKTLRANLIKLAKLNGNDLGFLV